jgi:hypothetical protein
VSSTWKWRGNCWPETQLICSFHQAQLPLHLHPGWQHRHRHRDQVQLHSHLLQLLLHRLQNDLQLACADTRCCSHLLTAALHTIEAIRLTHQALLTPWQPADQLLQLLRLLPPLLLFFLILERGVMGGDQIAQLHAAVINNDAIQAADRLHVHQQLLEHAIRYTKRFGQLLA